MPSPIAGSKDEVLKPAQSPLTSVPCMTGLRPSIFKANGFTEALESTLTVTNLRDASRVAGVSVAVIIQAAWGELLTSYTGASDGVCFLSLLPRDCEDACCSRLERRGINHYRREHHGIGTSNGSFLAKLSDCLSWDLLESNHRASEHESATVLPSDGTVLDLRGFFGSIHGRSSVPESQSHRNINAVITITVRSIDLEAISIQARFLSSHLSSPAAQLIITQLEYILRAVATNPECSVNDIYQHAPTALASISTTTAQPFHPFTSLHSQFEDHAEEFPDRRALEFWTNDFSLATPSLRPSTILTYGEINHRASTLAAHLLSHLGNLKNQIIPICMDRSPDLYISILGILKAGGAWCPIDPSFPSRRRYDLITRTHAKALIVNKESLIDGMPENVLVIDLAGLEEARDSSSSPLVFTAPTISPNDLAYLIWTSGTTGPPKGVPIHHHAASTSMRALQSLIPTSAESPTESQPHEQLRTVQFSAFSFDVFVQDLFYTWGHGGTLIAASRSIMLGSFAELATSSKATHAHLTPAFGASVSREACPTLEIVTMIGEKLEQGVADAWSACGRLYNTYGPAEASVVATLREKRAGENIQAANIGLPLNEVGAFVIRDGYPVFKGGVGELALSGPRLSYGYWDDEANTAERFVWYEELGVRLYMTGDIVRQLYDDSFEFVGRVDDLVKIQGIRVELSEIAFALRNCHRKLRQVEVQFLARPDRPSKVIVAFLVVPESSKPDSAGRADDLCAEVARSALKRARLELPEYMVPKVFLVVGAIPRTASSKVDRAAIRKLYAHVDLEAWEKRLTGAVDGKDASSRPNGQDLQIMDMISDLTGTEIAAMSQASTLPSIGIDSITATRLATKLIGQGHNIAVVDILQCRTIGDLLQYSRTAQARPNRGVFDTAIFHEKFIGLLDPDLANHVELVMPTLPFQESLLSESFRDPSSYWSHSLFALKPGIELQRLECAWGQVAQNTDALKTGFYPTAKLMGPAPIKATFLQLTYRRADIEYEVVESSRTTLNDDVRARSDEIASNYHTERSTEPPWAATIFTGVDPPAMLFSIHHSIRDEQSLDFIMTDLHKAYASAGMKPRHQLRDAISLLHANDAKSERDDAFWTDCLLNFADTEGSKSWPELKLSTREATHGTLTHKWISKQSYKTLQARITTIDSVSLASLLRVAWSCILLEYLETDNLVFGETRSARGESSTMADVIGPLVRVVPVPIDARDNRTARQILQADAEFQRTSKAYHAVHPSAIRKILGKAEGEVLYPAVFNFLPDSEELITPPDELLWDSMDDVVGLSVEHAIALSVYLPGSDTVEFELTAGKQYVDRAHLEMLAQQLDALTEYILEKPECELSQCSHSMPRQLLSVMPAEDGMLHNSAWTEDPAEWVDRNAQVHPDWPAAEVVDSLSENGVASKIWSCQQLHQAYRAVAAMIHAAGHTKKMIAVCLDRRLDVYAVVLAIMYTGNTYLPIAEDLPEDRKKYLLTDSEAVMLFTTRSLALSFTKGTGFYRTIFVEELDYTAPVKFEIEDRARPTDGAYLLYTSGSTGAPKGVIVSRGNLTSFIAAISHFIGSHVDMASLTGKGKWLGMASHAFDVHLLEMFFPWRHGMSTVTAPRTLLLDNLELALQKLSITHASFVPSLVDNVGLDPAKLPDLRYMSVGGEKIARKTIDTWSSSHVVLANAYGPTEATIGCCFKKVEADTNVRNVGFPLAYTTAHVLRHGTTEYTLRGTAGELCLTGDLVASGYHKRPDAKGFVEDFNGSRMYRTGDRVRMMADGSLEFLGRDDDQTKIRGQRIELVEVSDTVRIATEEALDAGKVEVAAMVIQHPSLARPQLIAFVAVQGTSPKRVTGNDVEVISFQKVGVVEEIRAYCTKTLPSFMVPEHFVCLTSLPLAPTSRKIDNKRLRSIFTEMSLTDLMSQTESTPSSPVAMGEMERMVGKVAAEVLLVDEARIDVDTNLFRFGLDSLNIINLMIKLQKVGLECTVSKILKGPTVRQIALLPPKTTQNGTAGPRQRHPGDLKRRFCDEVKNGIDLRNIAAVRPCLPLQETLVASSVDHEGEALYVNHITLELSWDIDRECLMSAWIATARDHEILRTCFHELGKHFVQVVLEHCPLTCDEINIPSSHTSTNFLHQLEPSIGADIIAHIDSKPPVRLTFAECREKAMLMISIHHALYDAESFSMILDEVYARYDGIATTVVRTPVIALIDHVESQSRQHARSFWKTYLQSYESRLFPFPLDAAVSEPATASKRLTTPLKTIEENAASLNSTPASMMQALFGVILAEILDTNDIVFGTVLSGRTIPVENAHTILAPCITTIPQRVTIDNDHSLADLISKSQKSFADSIEYQHTALRDIHHWVEAEAPLFDSLFSYTRKRDTALWSHLWRETNSSMPSEFPLALEIEADLVADRVVVRVNYTTAFGTAEKAWLMLERLEGLIESLVRRESDAVGTGLSMKAPVWPPAKVEEGSFSKEEILMRDIVAELVGLPSKDVAVDTSFFALGLDSIVAIQFAKRLRRHGIHCSSAHVMRYSSIRKLARRLASEKGADTNGHVISPTQVSSPEKEASGDVLATYPCTPLQSSMLTQTLGSDGLLYLHHHGIRLSANVDPREIRKAWEELVSRTEILRTTFHFSPGNASWMGFVHSQPNITWYEHDPDMSLEHVMSLIRRRLVLNVESSFETPPWAVDLLGDVLILSLHHSLYDGESLPLMLRDFSMLCRDIEIGTRLPFSRAAQAISEGSAEAETFWACSLDGFKVITTLTASYQWREVRTTLDLDLAALSEGCKRLGVTLQSVALLAFGKTLAWLSDRLDIVFGHVVSGRSIPTIDAEGIVGPLFNTIPRRVDLSNKSTTNKDAVHTMQATTGDSQTYQHASLSKVQQMWQGKTGRPDARLLEALFVFQKRAASSEDVLWRPITVEDDDTAATEYPINFEFEQRETDIGICMNSTCVGDLDAFVRAFESILLDIVRNPGSEVGKILEEPPKHINTGSDRNSKYLPLSSDGSPPRDDELCTLRKVLAQLSGIPADSIHDSASIFSLGLDSISAIQIAANGRKEGLNVSVADVLQGRTVRGIGQRMRQGKGTDKANGVLEPSQAQNGSISHPESTHTRDPESNVPALAGLRDENVAAVLPCSAGQYYHLAMWLKSGRTLGEATFSYVCKKLHDPDRLLSAWRRLREKHPILRTAFAAMGSKEAFQIVLKPSAVRSDAFQCIELPDHGEDSIKIVLRQEACRHFDLWSPPVELLMVHGRGKDYVVLRLHHALYDAAAISRIVDELSKLYQGEDLVSEPESPLQNTSPSLPPHIEGSRAYWRESLDGCQQTLLSPKVQASSTGLSGFFFARHSVNGLAKLERSCQRLDTSLPTVILLAFARTLAHYTGVSNPVFGQYQAGRFSLDGTSGDDLHPRLNVTPLLVRDVATQDTRTSIRAIETHLAARIPFEQTCLHEILEYTIWEKKPLLNTFINILSPTRAGTQSQEDSDNTLFMLYKVENFENITPTERVPGRTAVDALDTTFLADGNLFLDVERDGDGGKLRFVARCDKDVLGEEDVGEFLERVEREMGMCVGNCESE